MPRAVKCARSKMGIALLSRNWWEFTYTKIPLSISLSLSHPLTCSHHRTSYEERERGGGLLCVWQLLLKLLLAAAGEAATPPSSRPPRYSLQPRSWMLPTHPPRHRRQVSSSFNLLLLPMSWGWGRRRTHDWSNRIGQKTKWCFNVTLSSLSTSSGPILQSSLSSIVNQG